MERMRNFRRAPNDWISRVDAHAIVDTLSMVLIVASVAALGSLVV
jgi:hypothetical protein